MNKEYQININHFYNMEYIEESRKMTIEIDFREPQLYLSIDLIKRWEKPYQKETIRFLDKKRILNNIYHYLVNERKFSKVQFEEEKILKNIVS